MLKKFKETIVFPIEFSEEEIKSFEERKALLFDLQRVNYLYFLTIIIALLLTISILIIFTVFTNFNERAIIDTFGGAFLNEGFNLEPRNALQIVVLILILLAIIAFLTTYILFVIIFAKIAESENLPFSRNAFKNMQYLVLCLPILGAVILQIRIKQETIILFKSLKTA